MGEPPQPTRLARYNESNLQFIEEVGGTEFETSKIEFVQGALSANSAGQIIFLSGIGGESMRIQTDGNVGIGCNNPQSILDLIGNLDISGSLNLTGGEFSFQSGSSPSDRIYSQQGQLFIKRLDFPGEDQPVPQGIVYQNAGDVSFFSLLANSTTATQASRPDIEINTGVGGSGNDFRGTSRIRVKHEGNVQILNNYLEFKTNQSNTAPTTAYIDAVNGIFSGNDAEIANNVTVGNAIFTSYLQSTNINGTDANISNDLTIGNAVFTTYIYGDSAVFRELDITEQGFIGLGNLQISSEDYPQFDTVQPTQGGDGMLTIGAQNVDNVLSQTANLIGLALVMNTPVNNTVLGSDQYSVNLAFGNRAGVGQIYSAIGGYDGRANTGEGFRGGLKFYTKSGQAGQDFNAFRDTNVNPVGSGLMGCKMKLTDLGSLLIAQESEKSEPSAKLHVDGDAIIEDNLTVNGNVITQSLNPNISSYNVNQALTLNFAGIYNPNNISILSGTSEIYGNSSTDYVKYQDDNNCFDLTTGKYTIPQKGHYKVEALIGMTNKTDLEISIKVDYANNTPLYKVPLAITKTDFFQPTGFTTTRLDEGTKIYLEILRVSGGGTKTLIGTSTDADGYPTFRSFLSIRFEGI